MQKTATPRGRALPWKSPQLIPTRIGKASDAVQAEIGGAEPGSYYSGPAYRGRERHKI